MYLAHKTKLYPDDFAVDYFNQGCGVARHAYNWGLDEWDRAYKAGEKPNANKVRNKYNSVRREQFPWSYNVSKWCSQSGLENVGEAYDRFFKKLGKYPKRKAKKGNNQSFTVYNTSSASLLGGTAYLKLAKMKKPVKMAESLRFEGRIISVTVTKHANEWFASFTIELKEDFVYQKSCDNQTAGGVDLGVKTLATCSDGTAFENPQALKKALKKIKRLQKSMSRKKKGSRNRAKARMKLAVAHRKVANIRAWHLHELTSWLVKTFRFIGIEDLNVAGMLKNHKLARAIADVGFGEFRKQLEYKAKLAGCTVVVADRFFPSSKMCNDCGTLNQKLTLADRTWQCDCGMVHDRDVNAAINLKNLAQKFGDKQNAC